MLIIFFIFEQKNRTMTQTLPTTIVVRQQYNDADTLLRKDVQALQCAFKTLLSIEEIQPLPSLAEVTDSWVRSIVEPKKELIKADASLTAEERKQRFNSWNFVIGRSAKAIANIANILQTWSAANWQYDETIRNYYCTNIEEVVTSFATHQVPEEAHQHFRMIQEAIDKVRQLREWENTNDIKSYPLADLQIIPTLDFAEAWLNGSIKFDRKFAHLGINPRNYKDPKNPDRLII